MEQARIVIDNMEDVRREIDNCQRKAMTSVVELGYILRKADDARLYKEQGYTSIFIFAKEEYGWSQSQTSRFMDINREFSEGGYSTILKERYKGFGQAKLAEMLTLPETIREELDPDMKRDDIREIKSQMREAEQEEKENAFEAAVFEKGTDGTSLNVEKLFFLPDMARKLEDLYPFMQKAAGGEPVQDEDIRMALSSTGFGTVRVGGVMFFWKRDGVVAVKGIQKNSFSYTELLEAVNGLQNPLEKTPEEWYRNVYGKELPGQKAPEKENNRPEQIQNPEEKEEKTEPASGIETSANSGDSGTEDGPELKGKVEIGVFTEKMPVGQAEEDREQEKTEPEKQKAAGTEPEPVPSIETSANKGDSDSGEPEPEPEPENEIEKGDSCCYCDGTQPMKGNNGLFELWIHKNGLVRVSYKEEHAIMEFSFCPVCGKELGRDEE